MPPGRVPPLPCPRFPVRSHATCPRKEDALPQVLQKAPAGQHERCRADAFSQLGCSRHHKRYVLFSLLIYSPVSSGMHSEPPGTAGSFAHANRNRPAIKDIDIFLCFRQCALQKSSVGSRHHTGRLYPPHRAGPAAVPYSQLKFSFPAPISKCSFAIPRSSFV